MICGAIVLHGRSQESGTALAVDSHDQCRPHLFAPTASSWYPRGKGTKAVDHHWGEDGSVLDYVEARRRIYCPCYLVMLRLPDRTELIQRLREAAAEQHISLWDPDSYDVTKHGMSNIVEAIEYTKKPFAHAFLVALAVMDRLDELNLQGEGA